MRVLIALVPIVALLSLAGAAAAHSGGVETIEARFTMPVWVPWLAGGLVVAVSFLVVAVFLGRDPETGHGKVLPQVEPVVRAAGVGVGHVVGTTLWSLIIAAALVPDAGVFPGLMFWTVVWAGLATVSYLWGDVWVRVSPFRLLGAVVLGLRRGRATAAYPAWLGAWPSVAFLLALIGLEVTSAVGHGATSVGRYVLGYTLFTLLGIWRYGEVWSREAEVLGRSFHFWAACSPFRREDGKLRLGLPGARLDALPVVTLADVAFIVGLLYGVNHDAFANGPPGASLLLAMKGHVPAPFDSVLVLVGGYLVFLGVFLGCAARMRKASAAADGSIEVAARFAGSLVPIAVGYHLAHHLPLFVEAAPLVVGALSDPFGLGWDVGLGTVTALALSAWWLGVFGYLQVFFILTGHILAVVAAHRLAVRVFPGRVQALKAEIPLTVVMVFYTLVGLWLVSGAASGGAV